FLGDTDLAVASHKVRADLGYLPENTPLYGDMTVLEFLEIGGRLRGLRGKALRGAAARVIEQCGLRDRLRTPIAHLSKGYKQRVGLAQAMIHQPRILVLDEPTTGLDPNQVRYIKSLIAELGRSRTVLLSTHLLHQVPQMCDRVLVLHRGRLIFDGTPAQMAAQAGPPAEVLVKAHADPEVFAGIRADCPFITDIHAEQTSGDVFSYRLRGSFDSSALVALSKALHQKGMQPISQEPVEAPLDHVFAQLTGEEN
ncbi:MAG: ABC transporter ATP-binding protein, partial [Acidobacteriota bacterium]|nr:ABC transporter ATP-binding protein [Acidobacteriota bacterium]